MEVKSIKLFNFRQFKNETLEFSTDPERNVTIILGENGSGKTTLEQAFFWCFYGTTKFKDKIVLNRVVAEKLTNSSQNAKTIVEIRLTHENENFIIRRTQAFKRANNGYISGQPSVLEIGKVKDGNITYEFTANTPSNELQKNFLIQRILPTPLSQYFFFDGEVINEMSSEIATGKKSAQFAEAVRGLTGLRSLQMAIKHMGKGNTGVIGKFNEMFQGDSNDNLVRNNKIIANCEDEIIKNHKRLEELESLIDKAEKEQTAFQEELKTFEEAKTLQKAKEDNENKLNYFKQDKEKQIKNICKVFSQNSSKYVGIALVNSALAILAKSDLKGKDIPGVDINTINYLLERQKCICGTHLDPGSMPYQEVAKLQNYVPPESIGTVVRQFITKTQSDYQTDVDLFNAIKENLATISRDEDNIANLENDIAIIEQQLVSANATDRVKQIQSQINECRKMKREYKEENDHLNKIQGVLETRKKDCENENRKLVLIGEQNRLAYACKSYTNELIRRFEGDYCRREKEIREKLQKYINEMFLKIYGPGITLNIDEKYNVNVEVSDLNDVETSTAQSNSVVFAFITAIIKMAKENRKKDVLYAEPYPLVMDAPLSTFDKRRIEAICNQIPKIAEQVIIFIKDTDGDIAKQYLQNRIDKTFELEKIDDFHTKLVPATEA